MQFFNMHLGDFGGGTTARSLYSTLTAANISTYAVNLPGAEVHHHSNTSILLTSPSDALFDIFAINAINTVPILTHPAVSASCFNYRIGVWHWETSYLPSDHMKGLEYFDEVWVPATYIARAIVNSLPAATSTKIVVVPYGYDILPPVVTPDIRSQARSALLTVLSTVSAPLPHTRTTLQAWASSTHTTVFLIVFDFNSDMERKNVLKTIEIFAKTFPNDSSAPRANDVGLLIKSVNSEDQPEDYSSLLAQLWLMNDPRIVLLDGHLIKSHLELLRCASSVYVSLHRSEGWGLNILEAIFSAIPIVVSGFGGSEEYLLPLSIDTPEIRIPTSEVNLHRNFGPYTTSMKWGEPNNVAAAVAMQLIHSHYQYYSERSVNLRNRAIELLSPYRAGKIVEKRLIDVKKCLEIVYRDSNSSSAKNFCRNNVLGRRKYIYDREVCSANRRGFLRVAE